MEFLENLRDSIVHFKLNLCCFVARVKVGILLFGYFNLISSVLSLISAATGSFPPLYVHAQQSFMEGEYVKSSAMVAYSTELCASVMVLCAMYREDVILLKYFTYVGMAMATCSLVVYGMVIGILDMLTTILVFVSLFYQVYLILLVRSVIVDIKEAAKQNRYRKTLRRSDVEAIYFIPERRYSSVIEPYPIEPESPILPVKEFIVEPDITAEVKTIKEENCTIEETKLSYPFKFVAIKIPKEGRSKEKDETNEENVKKDKKDGDQDGTDKDVKPDIKEKTDEEVVREIIKPQKRSIFSRKKKEKVHKTSKTTADESKKP